MLSLAKVILANSLMNSARPKHYELAFSIVSWPSILGIEDRMV